MTDDLISRQTAIDALQEEINKGTPPFDDTIGAIRCGVRLARNIIEDLPSAQQKIVRCNECEFSEVYQNDSSGVMGRFCEAFTQLRMASDDDFCSYGERREP